VVLQVLVEDAFATVDAVVLAAEDFGFG